MVNHCCRYTTMLYSTQPTQSDDGTYFVKATTNEKRKKFVQLNQATVSDVSMIPRYNCISLEPTSSGVELRFFAVNLA